MLKHFGEYVELSLGFIPLVQVSLMKRWEIQDPEIQNHLPKDTQLSGRNYVFWLQDQCSFHYIMPAELILSPSFMLPEAVLVIS